MLFLSLTYSPTQLDRVTREVHEALDLLALRLVGQREFELAHLGFEHRYVLVRHIKIIYYVDGETVYVTDFFDTRQDPQRMQG